MKRFVIICSVIIALLSGCANSDSPEILNESQSISIESINVSQLLHLQNRQKYDVFDYKDDIALILISDTTKHNTSDINDQVVTSYYESFILLNLSTQSTVAQYEIQQFGICTSALSVFDGVLFSFFTVNSVGKLDSSIYFLDDEGMQAIYQGNFTPFGMGPILHHHNSTVLFSYYDHTDDLFGLKEIRADLGVKSILCFSPEDADYISDDFKTSEAYYGYTVGVDSKVTFYVGTGTEPPIQISLPANTKIHAFDITESTLIVSIAEDTFTSKDFGYSIEMFDLSTGQPIFIEQSQVPRPLYSISVSKDKWMCGFYYSNLKLFELNNAIQEVDLDTSMVQGSFYKIFSSANHFLVVTYGFETKPNFWLLSY